MTFDNSYPNRKDWRRQYSDSKAVDRTCRNHGSCPHCRNNRLHKHRRKEPLKDDDYE